MYRWCRLWVGGSWGPRGFIQTKRRWMFGEFYLLWNEERDSLHSDTFIWFIVYCEELKRWKVSKQLRVLLLLLQLLLLFLSHFMDFFFLCPRCLLFVGKVVYWFTILVHFHRLREKKKFTWQYDKNKIKITIFQEISQIWCNLTNVTENWLQIPLNPDG